MHPRGEVRFCQPASSRMLDCRSTVQHCAVPSSVTMIQCVKYVHEHPN